MTDRLVRPERIAAYLAAAFLCASLVPGTAYAQLTKDAPRPWSIEVKPIMDRYLAGAYVEVQDACAALLREDPPTNVRRDALALWSIALLRSDSRSDRADGFSRLKLLAQEEPGLLNRPECLLASGLGQLGQHRTPAALESLDAAARGYAARGDLMRQAESLVGLARAWAAHNEWLDTPPVFAEPVPDSPAASHEARRSQIERVRERAEALPDGGATAAHIDLVLAELLVRNTDTEAEGLALAERLAADALGTPVGAAACMLAGDLHERAGRAAEAIRLFERVAQAGQSGVAAQAALRVAALRAPRLELSLPRSVASTAPVALQLRARNLAKARVEVRRIGLPDLLGQRQGRFSESALPVAGSLQFEGEVEPTAPPLEWWESGRNEARLMATLPVGAYCVHLLGEGLKGEHIEVRRLLLVSDLQAAAGLADDGRVLVWAVRDGVGVSGEGARVQFWMYGSFVPTRAELHDGVAHFDVPPEARVLIEKRWVCLVRDGEHLALFEGELPREDALTVGTVLLDASPKQVDVAEPVTIVGLLDRTARRAARQHKDEVDILLIDDGDRVRRQARVPVEAGGVIQAAFTFSEAEADQVFAIVLKIGGRPVESVRGPDTIRVASRDRPEHRIEIVVPRHSDPQSAPPTAEVRAAYPWGVPIGEVTGSIGAFLVSLPPAPDAHRADSSQFFRTNSLGRYRFLSMMPALAAPDGDLAMNLRASVPSFDGRMSSSDARLLRSEKPAYAWIRLLRRESANANDPVPLGEPVRFAVGAYAPGSEGLGSPRLEILADAQPVHPLSLLSSGPELESEQWTPSTPGQYVVRVTFPAASSDAVEQRLTFRVADPSATRPAQIECAALFTPRAFGGDLVLDLRGQRPNPLLAVASNGRRAVATAVAPSSGREEVRLPFRAIDGETWVSLLEMHSRPAVTHTMRAGPDKLDAIIVETELTPETPLPGAPVTVSVRCARADGRPVSGSVVARLVLAFGEGDVPWIPGEARAPMLATPQLVRLATDSGASGAAEPWHVSNPQFRWPTIAAMLNLPSEELRVARLGSGGVAKIELLPLRAETYRLVLVVCSEDGEEAVEEVILDASAGFELDIVAPRIMSVGDRCPAAIHVRAGRRAPDEADLVVSSAAGMAIEGLTTASRAAEVDAADPRRAKLRLRSGAELTLLATLEASREGVGSIECRMTSAQGESSEASRLEVIPASTAAGGDSQPAKAIRVERSIFRLVKKVEIDPPAGPSDTTPRFAKESWIEEALVPGAPLTPGDRLLVREVITCPSGSGPVTWSQRLPPTCFSLLGPLADYAPLGPPYGGALDHYVWRPGGLSNQPFRHEYVLVAVRPGSGRIPWPEVVAETEDGRKNPARIEVNPPDSLVVVGGK